MLYVLPRVVVARTRENGLTRREGKECKLGGTFAVANVVLQRASFYTAQLACLLLKAVEAKKKVEMQECRRWKPWALCGENVEFVAKLSPAPDDAKRKMGKRVRVQARRQEQS